ncbi:tol-pal system protein YbgF [Paragemmobacter straminiformis]|uniref:Cell division coordinator CpoB n=1 Tax=Paragemmobacter straminiformis TaxID=2045119 RepID=A0A842IBK1_9RHOB|nr:tol-pal system protein YbgF [Gemmobacter straminiformis]MBC2837230.1 tol-pal system protein YbgF [Gemmobacter straminiformis]
MLRLGLILMLALMPAAVSAQDKAQTLADIRAELDLLMGDFNALKAELVQSGGAGTGAGGGDALQRMDTIEAALTRLTAKTEEVELKLNKVVSDGTNRIGDIEFRLCEATEGCDPATLPETPTLGGAATGGTEPAPVSGGTTPAVDPATGGGTAAPELALNEKADFDKANALYTAGDFRGAADQFASFAQNYPGGPLTQEAAFLRGESLAQLGDTAGSARSYLEAFSGQPSGPRAGQALLKLGQALGALGQTPEACVTLQEVGTRFPGSAEAGTAVTSMQGLGCS